MLDTFKDFFSGLLGSQEPSSAADREHILHLATAALLLEISRSDHHIHEEELNKIDACIQSEFGLSAAEARELIELANHEVEHSVSMHEFTSLLNRDLSREERVRIVELLWHVAYADGVLDKYEEYYVRKIADLLYVSQKDFIQTKHKAAAQ